MPQSFKVCTDVDHLKAGESFKWVNSTDNDCTLTKCKPPLTKSRYVVKKHSSLPAKVQDPVKVGNYDYECDCSKRKRKNNPKIIIGTD
jgi:hypothetical protein